MRLLIISSCLLALAHCNYRVAPTSRGRNEGSYPTPPPTSEYDEQEQEEAYPVAPRNYGRKYNPAPVYSQDSNIQSAPPAPITDTQLRTSSVPEYGGSVPASGNIAGGSNLNYNSVNSNYRRRAKARARAPTVQNRRFFQRRRPLQPIRRFHKKARQ